MYTGIAHNLPAFIVQTTTCSWTLPVKTARLTNGARVTRPAARTIKSVWKRPCVSALSAVRGTGKVESSPSLLFRWNFRTRVTKEGDDGWHSTSRSGVETKMFGGGGGTWNAMRRTHLKISVFFVLYEIVLRDYCVKLQQLFPHRKCNEKSPHRHYRMLNNKVSVCFFDGKRVLLHDNVSETNKPLILQQIRLHHRKAHLRIGIKKTYSSGFLYLIFWVLK